MSPTDDPTQPIVPQVMPLGTPVPPVWSSAPGPLPPPPGQMPAAQMPQAPRDPNLLWEGERKAIGPSRVRYRITREFVSWESGRVSTNAEQVPLWAIHGVDAHQTVTQKARGVGDVVLNLEPNNYTQDRANVTLESIDAWRYVCEMLLVETERARRERHSFHNTQTINQNTQLVHQAMPPYPQQPYPQHPPPVAPAASLADPASGQQPVVSVADELRKLVELRDLGALTDEEFAVQKARILG